MKGGLDKRRSVFLGRRLGATPAARERLNAFNAEQTWIGKCRKCKAPVKGTLSALSTHKCEGGDGPNTSDAGTR
jgi:hypothetical protein